MKKAKAQDIITMHLKKIISAGCIKALCLVVIIRQFSFAGKLLTRKQKSIIVTIKR